MACPYKRRRPGTIPGRRRGAWLAPSSLLLRYASSYDPADHSADHSAQQAEGNGRSRAALADTLSTIGANLMPYDAHSHAQRCDSHNDALPAMVARVSEPHCRGPQTVTAKNVFAAGARECDELLPSQRFAPQSLAIAHVSGESLERK